MAYYPNQVYPGLQVPVIWQNRYGLAGCNFEFPPLPTTQSTMSAAAQVQPQMIFKEPRQSYASAVTYNVPPDSVNTVKVCPTAMMFSPNATYFSTIGGTGAALAAAPASAVLPVTLRASPGQAYFVAYTGNPLV